MHPLRWYLRFSANYYNVTPFYPTCLLFLHYYSWWLPALGLFIFSPFLLCFTCFYNFTQVSSLVHQFQNVYLFVIIKCSKSPSFIFLWLYFVVSYYFSKFNKGRFSLIKFFVLKASFYKNYQKIEHPSFRRISFMDNVWECPFLATPLQFPV